MVDRLPTVSVVVTAFNQEAYIIDALRSVLAQSYRDFETIVVDDGSADSTAQRVEAFGAGVRLVRQANQGVAGSRNAGTRHARGRLLAFLDGDDLWERDKLARQVAAAERHPSSGLVAVGGRELGNPAGPTDTLFAPPLQALLAGKESLTIRCHKMFLRHNLISTTSQVMIPREVLHQVGLSDTAFRVSSDWDLYIRIAARYEMTFLSAPLVTWRFLESSASGPLVVRQLRWAEDDVAILKKHLIAGPAAHRPLIRDLIRSKILASANTAYYYGKGGARRVARRHLLRLLRTNPEKAGTILFFLIGLHSPDLVTRSFGPILRRMPITSRFFGSIRARE
jgi:glycosyltransferase involved in cell wall biosynthesis